ncbi:MAG TPA: GH92 family glycosyl hydrolase [Verrucomicrobiae bacterium]|nr:GH92 family glycosyl hydrolase [Verrucomicrobiae bacterium]
MSSKSISFSRVGSCAAAATLFLALSLKAELPVDDALPMVGTDAHGHTFPGATLPFGFVQLSPDTRDRGWDACGGYYYTDNTIDGFSHTHLSGTGCTDLGDVLVLPMTGELNTPGDYQPLDSARFKSNFSHDEELAQPGYYRVKLDTYNILAELTATTHCGMHRYTFPASRQSHILIDLVHGIGNTPVSEEMTVVNKHLVTGFKCANGWAKGRLIYFALETSRPIKDFGLEADGKPLAPGATDAKGKGVRGHLDFRTSKGEQIILRIGISPTSVDEAEKNLETELPNDNFDAVREAARNTWNENLSRIQIEASNPDIRQTFYSCMYHSMIAPQLCNNADGTYRGPDKEVHTANFQEYSTFSMWDIYRAEAPLLMFTEPERINDFIQSMLAFYQESPDHALPVWPLFNYETGCMIGYHSIPIIRDAYFMGFRGFDPNLALTAMVDTATNGRNRQDEYQKYGYIPWEKGQGAATSRTIELSYDDWCIAQMAKDLGKADETALFSKRADYYKNVWDPSTRFFRSKQADGTYHEPFNDRQVVQGGNDAARYYTEADAWQYAFGALQDIPGMIALYGGNHPFIARLDELFDADSYMSDWRSDTTGLIGQYSHGNEPDEATPYLYSLAGAPYKTAWIVREIQLTQYDNTPEGLDGNDDCGQISAWYVWSALGLYPANPANGIYVIGSPLVQKAVINLDPKYYKGGTFTIIAHNCTKQYCYVQSATLNGQPLNHPWITKDDIIKGGTLELDMGLLPNKNWGTEGAESDDVSKR